MDQEKFFCIRKIRLGWGLFRKSYKRAVLTCGIMVGSEIILVITHRLSETLPYLIISVLLCAGSVFGVLIILISDPGFLNLQPVSGTIPHLSIFRIRFMEIPINGQLLKLKYCKSCNILRPLRTSHCSICMSCVEKYDHHCPWLGTCIGKKNYRGFFFLLLNTTLYIVFAFITCVVNLQVQGKNAENFTKVLENAGTSFFLSFLAGTVTVT